jgi:hypothetical protein
MVVFPQQQYNHQLLFTLSFISHHHHEHFCCALNPRFPSRGLPRA